MADTIVWNKKLLVASVVVALLAGILVWIWTGVQEDRAKGDQVRVWKWKRDIASDTEVKAEDVELIEVQRSTAAKWENLRPESQNPEGEKLTRGVRKEDPVRQSDFIGGGHRSNIAKGKRGFTIRIDPSLCLGDLVRPGTKVDILANIKVGEKQEMYVVLKNVRVLAVGGVGGEDPTAMGTGMNANGRPPATPIRQYRNIAVELDADTMLQVAHIQAYIDAPFQLAVRGSDEPGSDKDAKVEKAVLDTGILSKPIPVKNDNSLGGS